MKTSGPIIEVCKKKAWNTYHINSILEMERFLKTQISEPEGPGIVRIAYSPNFTCSYAISGNC